MKAGWSCNPAVGTPWRKPFLWRFVLAVPFPEGSVTKPRDEDKSQNVWPHIRLLIHEFINSFIPRSAVSKYRAKRSFFSVRRQLRKRRKKKSKDDISSVRRRENFQGFLAIF